MSNLHSEWKGFSLSDVYGWGYLPLLHPVVSTKYRTLTNQKSIPQSLIEAAEVWSCVSGSSSFTLPHLFSWWRNSAWNPQSFWLRLACGDQYTDLWVFALLDWAVEITAEAQRCDLGRPHTRSFVALGSDGPCVEMSTLVSVRESREAGRSIWLAKLGFIWDWGVNLMHIRPSRH